MEIPVKIMRLNELDACERFIEILRFLTGIEYVEFERPDEINRSTPDVELVLVSSSNKNDKIAVEHTKVETFDGQIEYLNRSWDIVGLVNAGCRGRTPSDRCYYLAVPPILVDSLVSKRSRKLFVSDISSWVVETAPKLLLPDSRAQKEYEGHKVTLTCIGDCGKFNGNVGRMPEEPENQKVLQGERLGRAVKTKISKLTKYKEQGFKTALLLEDVAGTLRGSALTGYQGLEEVDYIVVFVSNDDRMIIGNVWKEGPVWHSSVPSDRRFPRKPRNWYKSQRRDVGP
ncbi:MAG TPA: hypothetical protein VGU23_09655 [Acidobacteriaceae bacterium]|nr:hypothetical protein [Acidobacteriaceae bacterium]